MKLQAHESCQLYVLKKSYLMESTTTCLKTLLKMDAAINKNVGTEYVTEIQVIRSL